MAVHRMRETLKLVSTQSKMATPGRVEKLPRSTRYRGVWSGSGVAAGGKKREKNSMWEEFDHCPQIFAGL